MSRRRMLTIAESALLLGVSQRTIRRRIASGRLAVFHDGRVVRIPDAALESYVRRCTVPAAERTIPVMSARRAPSGAQGVVAAGRLWDAPDPLGPVSWPRTTGRNDDA